MKTYFTSDLHFYHKSQAIHRGFSSVDEMNDTIRNAWNKRVRMDDLVYLLGDVSFAGSLKTIEVLRDLNGRIVLVSGNHDNMSNVVLERFEAVHNLLEVKFPEHLTDGTSRVDRIVMCHYPILVWNRSHYGTWMLHGHSHGNCRYPNPNARIMDVGIDTRPDFAPWSFEEIKAIMLQRSGASFDHHVETEN